MQKLDFHIYDAMIFVKTVKIAKNMIFTFMMTTFSLKNVKISKISFSRFSRNSTANGRISTAKCTLFHGNIF